jgi:uncharacterized protein (TIGR02265 family)
MVAGRSPGIQNQEVHPREPFYLEPRVCQDFLDVYGRQQAVFRETGKPNGRAHGMSGVSAELHAEQSEAELEVGHRLALVTPQDTMRGMFFRSVKEAMLSLKGPAAMEACLAECGGVRTFVDLFAYPAGDFLRMLRQAAWMMEGAAGGFEESMRMLGYMGTAVFLGSQVGKAMQVLISGTPKRVIEYLPMAYKVTTPAGGSCSVAFPDLTTGLVTFERDFLPRPYVEGSLEAHLKQAGARSARITGRMRGPLACEYELTWDF